MVERFEAFAGALEVANGFSELNDPVEQRERFIKQLAERDPDDPDVDMEISEIDDDYVRSLEVGLPPTAGEGVGIDRLVMLLTDARSIREVILFPQLRPERGRSGSGSGSKEAAEGEGATAKGEETK